jgi:hypothetical protein
MCSIPPMKILLSLPLARVILLIFITLVPNLSAFGEPPLAWHIDIPPDLVADAAIRAAVEDLVETGESLGQPLIVGNNPEGASHLVLVGTARNNSHILALETRGHSVTVPANPEGFAIRTVREGGRHTMVVSSGSPLGQAYGLYWLWDRLRVYRRLPDINTTREPALNVRHTGGRDTGALHQALRYTANWVSDYDALNLVPWGVEPEETENAANRARIQTVLDAAHALHLKYLVYCDEFSYHPDWLAAQGATLDPEDPGFWAALQAKYRALFNALPDLDGIRIRTGEHTRVGGDYRPLDIMHEPENNAWPLDRRYRTFLQKLHAVVVGEFDKIYYHRTWVANAAEQHSDAAAYRAIFTEDVPTENLWLSPYLSLADRWYYQPFNPTFNQTPHKMVVLLATLDYHAAGNPVFPAFPGQYYQGGLLQILADPESNLNGAQFGVPARDGWDTASLTAYVAFRLAWEPWADLNTIARDFASIHLGPEAAAEMARALLLSHQAYKDGIYIKPVAESIVGNTLPHLRLTTFQLQGIPQIDSGKAHIAWLRTTLYEPCVGREAETMAFLELGRAATRTMEQITLRSHREIRDRSLADRVLTEAIQTRWLVECNVAYVRAVLAYFAYEETADETSRITLADAVRALESARTTFMTVDAFSYKLYGVDQLLDNARAILADQRSAEATLENAPDGAGTYAEIARRQSVDATVLSETHHGFTKALRWRGRVDGKDLLHIRGDSVRIEHLAYDHIQDDAVEFFTPMPARAVRVALRNLESNAPHPFVMTQPNAANDYTTTVYLFNRPPGYAWWEFELHYRE